MHKIMIIKIPGVLCPSYGMASNHVHDKTFPHLTTTHLFAQSISVGFPAGWLDGTTGGALKCPI
jgi:hypothetical protein